LRGLAERLSACGIEPVVTREPGGTPAADRLRAVLLDAPEALDPVTELFVVCAARAQHVAVVIEPALDAGRVVLCDRFSDATVAYQGYGRGLDREVVRTCCGYAAGGVAPNLTLLVDLSPALSRERVRARADASGVPTDRMEREDGGFHERVREGYLAIARGEPARVKILDGALPEDVLLERAWAHLSPAAGLV
jgi:dTMP kinase